MKTRHLLIWLLTLLAGIPSVTAAEHSKARLWNEVLLSAIRVDFARPTVHARNLFHTAVVMYDAWAAYDDVARPFLLGQTVSGFTSEFNGVSTPNDKRAARDEAISYAAYRLLKHRFVNSPGLERSFAEFDSLFMAFGYDSSFVSTDYAGGNPAALGNYIAQNMIEFGLQDGSNEQNGYVNIYYEPVNPGLIVALPGNPDLQDPNRWQPLTLDYFVDQAGNLIPGTTPPFLSPEWGIVVPFSLNESNLTVYGRDGFNYWVYHDPGVPPFIDLQEEGETEEEYKWNFTLVAVWSAHLDPTDGVMWDVSPGGVGDIQAFPETLEEYQDFYKLLDGGDPGQGYDVNPKTGESYEPQMVPRADYARVLAEFWADGPDSETPPGHWFTILNYVNDHPLFEKKFKGEGSILDDLEWDVKSYLIMGGALHDVAVAAWGIKGWYDYIRPISAIRFMADLGQSSDPNRPSYDPDGILLMPGYIDIVEEGDPLAIEDSTALGKIKLFAWRGPDYIENSETDVAGCGWILAENWWPYQRPTFVTPPFAGYVSGHSTYSRAAAEVMTLLTGDKFFPGGLGEFQCAQNEFLVFEDGPSMDLTLQWATYRDASDQCSLSRIWGGIHPPVDDIPGRLIGKIIGPQAFHRAEDYFNGRVTSVRGDHTGDNSALVPTVAVYPNPAGSSSYVTVQLSRASGRTKLKLYNILGQVVQTRHVNLSSNQDFVNLRLNTNGLASGLYFLKVIGDNWKAVQRIHIVR